DTRPGIAVLPCDNSGSYGQDKENFDALQKGIAGMLISELAANPAARVVEREEIEKLLAEQSLGASGKVTPETAAKIGKLVGARYEIGRASCRERVSIAVGGVSLNDKCGAKSPPSVVS